MMGFERGDCTERGTHAKTRRREGMVGRGLVGALRAQGEL